MNCTCCNLQARRLRHRVERLKRKRQWRKVVSEVTRARTEGVPLIESAQTLVLESYARDGRWREAIATLYEAHVKVSTYFNAVHITVCDEYMQNSALLYMMVDETSALQRFIFFTYIVIACALCVICAYAYHQNERVASVSYVWAMQACNKANKWQKAMSIWHDLLDRRNVELTEPACAAAIEVSTIAHIMQHCQSVTVTWYYRRFKLHCSAYEVLLYQHEYPTRIDDGLHIGLICIHRIKSFAYMY
jgi:hypothetical protein